MALSNTDREMLWVDGWNELYDLSTAGSRFVDEDYRELSVEDCKGRIQTEAYRGRRVVFSAVFFKGARARQLGFVAVE